MTMYVMPASAPTTPAVTASAGQVDRSHRQLLKPLVNASRARVKAFLDGCSPRGCAPCKYKPKIEAGRAEEKANIAGLGEHLESFIYNDALLSH